MRPENVASRRVLDKLGFREEGLHLRYLNVDDSWRDHLVYALTIEEVRSLAMATAATARSRRRAARYDRKS